MPATHDSLANGSSADAYWAYLAQVYDGYLTHLWREEHNCYAFDAGEVFDVDFHHEEVKPDATGLVAEPVVNMPMLQFHVLRNHRSRNEEDRSRCESILRCLLRENGPIDREDGGMPFTLIGEHADREYNARPAAAAEAIALAYLHRDELALPEDLAEKMGKTLNLLADTVAPNAREEKGFVHWHYRGRWRSQKAAYWVNYRLFWIWLATGKDEYGDLWKKCWDDFFVNALNAGVDDNGNVVYQPAFWPDWTWNYHEPTTHSWYLVSEYYDFAYSGFAFTMAMAAERFGVRNPEWEELTQKAARTILFFNWSPCGYPAWFGDGYGLARMWTSVYAWNWSLKVLPTVAMSDLCVPKPEWRGYARHLFDQAVAFHKQNDTAAGDPQDCAVPSRIYGHGPTADTLNHVKAKANASFVAITAMAVTPEYQDILSVQPRPMPDLYYQSAWCHGQTRVTGANYDTAVIVYSPKASSFPYAGGELGALKHRDGAYLMPPSVEWGHENLWIRFADGAEFSSWNANAGFEGREDLSERPELPTHPKDVVWRAESGGDVCEKSSPHYASNVDMPDAADKVRVTVAYPVLSGPSAQVQMDRICMRHAIYTQKRLLCSEATIVNEVVNGVPAEIALTEASIHFKDGRSDKLRFAEIAGHYEIPLEEVKYIHARGDAAGLLVAPIHEQTDYAGSPKLELTPDSVVHPYWPRGSRPMRMHIATEPVELNAGDCLRVTYALAGTTGSKADAAELAEQILRQRPKPAEWQASQTRLHADRSIP